MSADPYTVLFCSSGFPRSRVGGEVAFGVSQVATTDEGGNAELPVPVGSLEVRVTKEKLVGTAVVSVGEGAAVPVAVTLAPPKVNPPPP